MSTSGRIKQKIWLQVKSRTIAHAWCYEQRVKSKDFCSAQSSTMTWYLEPMYTPPGTPVKCSERSDTMIPPRKSSYLLVAAHSILTRVQHLPCYCYQKWLRQNTTYHEEDTRDPMASCPHQVVTCPRPVYQSPCHQRCCPTVWYMCRM
jgi:hypothetical protein